MSTLEQSTQLYLGQLPDTDRSGRPRILLSAGIEQVSTTVCESVPYDCDAFVPAPPWREPTADERTFLCTREIPTAPGAWVSLVRLPEDVLSIVAHCGLSQFTDAHEVDTVAGSVACRQMYAAVSTYATRFLIADNGYTVLGLGAHAPSLPTTTCDPKTGCLIGLHLDSWDQGPLEGRCQARNRIVINVGRDDRYLLYIPLGLHTMLAMLDAATNQASLSVPRPAHFETEFMQRFPSYPVVKLRIAPYEAYIAPTENIIHDGCTVGQTHVDLTVTFLGHFAATPLRPIASEHA